MTDNYTDIIYLQQRVGVHRDQAAYKKLFYHFYKPLTRFAANFVKSQESAEEVYCDVLLKLWDLGAALVNIENLKLYLYTSIRNASLNYLAKYNKMQYVDLDMANAESRPDANHTFDAVLGNEFQKSVNMAVLCLPPQCRLVYKLIKEENFSYKEVALLLNISVNTVEAHMKTALSRLRNSLKSFLRNQRD